MGEAVGSVLPTSIAPRRFPRAGCVDADAAAADRVSIATVRERLTACQAGAVEVRGAPGDTALDMTAGELDQVIVRLVRFLADALGDRVRVDAEIAHVAPSPEVDRRSVRILIEARGTTAEAAADAMHGAREVVLAIERAGGRAVFCADRAQTAICLVIYLPASPLVDASGTVGEQRQVRRIANGSSRYSVVR